MQRNSSVISSLEVEFAKMINPTLLGTKISFKNAISSGASRLLKLFHTNSDFLSNNLRNE